MASSHVPLPPAPGPRPDDFEFPFAEARAAKQAIEDLSDDLGTLMRTHCDAVESARVGWTGQTCTLFNRAFAELMSDFVSIRGLLDADAKNLGTAITTAQQRQRESQDAIANWERKVMSYHHAVAIADAEKNAF